MKDVEPVKWGILGTARIARMRVLPGLALSPSSQALAIASRNIEAAKALADEFAIPRAYGSYHELLADPDIEAVYIPLPNDMHVEYLKAAVESGKHVLCEKPMGISSAEVEAIVELGKRRIVTEAIMVRHHPQWKLARNKVRQGEVGDLRSVFCRLDYAVADPNDIRNRDAPGGGALFDLGIYGIIAARYFFESEPQRVLAYSNGGRGVRPDRNLSVILDFGESRHATIMASTECVNNQRLELSGTEGRIALVNPIQPSAQKPAQMQIELLGTSRIDSVDIEPAHQYANEVEAFSQAVRGEAPLDHGIEDAVANLKVIEAIYRSFESGRWEVS